MTLDCITPWNVVLNLFQAHECTAIYQSPVTSDPVSFLEYLPYFLKTCALELPIYWLFLKGKKGFLQILMINILLNLSTHPIVFFIIPLLLKGGTYFQYLSVAEFFAPLVEFLILWRGFKVDGRVALLAAVAANLFSWGLGIYWA